MGVDQMNHDEAAAIIETSTKCAALLNDLAYQLKGSMVSDEFVLVRRQIASIVADLFEELSLEAYVQFPDLAPDFMQERIRTLRSGRGET